VVGREDFEHAAVVQPMNGVDVLAKIDVMVEVAVKRVQAGWPSGCGIRLWLDYWRCVRGVLYTRFDRLFQVGDQILDALNARRKPHQSVVDAECIARIGGELGVAGA